MAHDTIITANDVYRALRPSLAKKLHDYCKEHDEDPVAVLDDALALHLDEAAGPVDLSTVEDATREVIAGMLT